MKQIQKTASIIAKLNQHDLSADDVVVFEAIAINTRPLRKQSKIYKGAVATRGLLLEMAAFLERESVQLQIMHDKSALPIGRVFEGAINDTGAESELRVLFAVSKTEQDHIAKIEAGVINQVSVSVLPKQILNSVSGFDYLGPDSTYEHIVSGKDPKGNELGVNGVHARLVGLDSWTELSLVGMGGAENARIVSRDDSIFSGPELQRLAASGVDPSDFLLTATVENDDVDLTTLVTQLTDTKVELSGLNTRYETLEAKASADAARVTELEAQLAAAGDAATTIAARDETIATLTASNTEAVKSLQDVARALLVAKGDVDPKIPDDIAELSALISESREALSASLVSGGKSKDATTKTTPTENVVSGAFRSAR